MMRLIKTFVAIGLLLAIASPAIAQSGCGGQFGAGKFCGNVTGSTGLPGPALIPAGGTTPIAGGTVLGNPTAVSAVPSATSSPVLGIPGTSTGQIGLAGATSGTAILEAQAAAGSAIILLPTSAGTLVGTSASPLAIDATTGKISITGLAGGVLAGVSPAFTTTPVLGASGTLGSIGFGNATSGIVTLKTVTGALGTVNVLLPAASGTVAVSASTPLVLGAANGALTCPTCVTSSGGGAITGTAPISVSAAGAVSINAPYQSLTASNGGIVWSDATNLNILAGTSTARQMLQSGATATPAWSTATWPATTTINQLLYSSSSNVVQGLATVNNGVLVTNGSGVPSITNVLPNGTTATTQSLNSGDIKVATDAYADRVGTNLLTTNNSWSGNSYFGSGVPWIDVKSGTHSCAAAVGNGVTDDTAAIQCQINWMNANTGGGNLFFPIGNYLVSGGGIIVKASVFLQGSGRHNTGLVSNTDSTVVTIDAATCSAGIGAADFAIVGYINVGATQDTFVVGANCAANVFRNNIAGGHHGLNNAGNDGVFRDNVIQGYTGDNVHSTGANWYFNNKLDDASSSSTGAAAFSQSAGTVGAENYLYRTDLSTSRTNSININASGSTTYFYGAIASKPIVISAASNTSFIGGEFASSTFTGNGSISIVGVTASTTVTPSGGTYNCAANFSVVCSSTTSVPVSSLTGLGTGVATALGQTLNGSGAISATTSPIFVTPTLGAATGTSVVVSNGFLSTGTYGGSFSDGIVTDYTTGTGRFSVGALDGFAWYNGGVAGTQIMSLTLGGTIGANNLIMGGSTGFQWNGLNKFSFNGGSGTGLEFIDSSPTGGTAIGFTVNGGGGGTALGSIAISNTGFTLTAVGGKTLTFQSNNVNALVLDTSANAVVSNTLSIAGMTNVATTSAVCFNTSTHLLTYDGTIGTCTVSDERLKNMGPRIDHALDKLLRIDGVSYTWKDPMYGTGPQIGVGAQTVEKVFPELVQTGSDGYKSVDYQRLTAPIIEALRELKADNDNLHACQKNWKCRIFGMR